jgi:hypothetical protein
MTITWNKILKVFFHITTILMVLGTILLFIDNEADIYGIWVLIAMLTGSYLIESKKNE